MSAPTLVAKTAPEDLSAKIDAVFDDIEGHLKHLVDLRAKEDDEQYNKFMAHAREELHERQDAKKIEGDQPALSRPQTRLGKDIEDLKAKVQAHREVLKAAAAGK